MAAVQEPATQWSGTTGEYSSTGVADIADPSANLLVDPSGNNIVDTGETFTQKPATVWGAGTETYAAPVWENLYVEGEVVVVGNLILTTNSGNTITTNSGNVLVTNTTQYVPTPATTWLNSPGQQ